MERSGQFWRSPVFATSLIVLLLGLGISIGLGSNGYPVPKGDDDFEKSPAAELALNGKMAIPGARGFIKRAEAGFACYPPIYQLSLAAWYVVVGFSFFSTQAFCYTVHLLNAVLISWVSLRFLLRQPKCTASNAVFLAAASGLIHVANLAYFDRPEEVALIWVWLEVLIVGRSSDRLRLVPSIATGVFVGLAGLTAPWVGLLAAAFVTARAFLGMPSNSNHPRISRLKKCMASLVISGAVSVLLVAGWAASMEWHAPGIMSDQFVEVLRYHREHQLAGTIGEKLQRFGNSIMYNPYQLVASLCVLVFFSWFAFCTEKRQESSEPLALFGVTVAGILCIAAIRPGAYTYLGASLILLLPLLGLAFFRFVCRDESRPKRMAGWLTVLACVAYSFLSVAGYGYYAANLPANERPNAAFDQLRKIIPAGDSVAVTYRHWYVFQNRNDWRNEFWSTRTDPDEILKCQWLVLFPGKAPPARIDAFELVEEITSTAPKNATFAYSVWRRKPSVETSR